MKDLYKQGELKGLVLDLRSDPGGLLNQAVAVSAAFLPKDALVVYTDGRTPDAHMRLTASKDNYSRRGEDFFRDLTRGRQEGADGGAGRRRHRVGLGNRRRRAAGPQARDGAGQPDLRQGLGADDSAAGQQWGLKLTTARYYTPAGRSIQAKGIEPDIAVDDGRESPNRIREANLDHHLDTSKAGKADAAAEARAAKADGKADSGESNLRRCFRASNSATRRTSSSSRR